jgi:hypothetical protein
MKYKFVHVFWNYIQGVQGRLSATVVFALLPALEYAIYIIVVRSPVEVCKQRRLGIFVHHRYSQNRLCY